MKVKVKGLVFVGFAAMIFAANAMAANEDKTVTSRAYTEATYQKKATENYKVSKSDGTWNDLATEVTENGQNAVTAGAIKSYVDSAIEGVTSGAVYQQKATANYKVSKSDGTWNDLGTTLDTDAAGYDSANAVTAGTIVSALDDINSTISNLNTTYQDRSSANYQLSSSNGGWVGLGTTLDTDAAGYDSANAVTAGTIVAAITDLESQIQSSTEATTYTADEVTIHLDTSNGGQEFEALTSAVASGAGTLVTGDDVYQYVTGYAAQNAEVNVQADWNVTDTTSDAYINNKPTLTNDSAEIGNATASDSTQLPSTYAVKQYVADQTGGAAIPAMDTSVCTASHPCALVNVNGVNHWYTMAQSGYDGGQCGDVGGCGA